MMVYTITEAQRQQLIYAMEIGLDCARDYAADVHEKYAGYKPLLHAAVDADVAAIEAAHAMLQSLEPVTQKPVAYITETDLGPMVWTPEMYDEACTYCDDDEYPVPLYTHPAPMQLLTDAQRAEREKARK